MELNELHKQMLKAKKFHLDALSTERGRIAAAELEQAGYVTCFDSGSDESQYTCLNYTITDAGREALKAR